jgi:hypothetical protein
VWGIVMTVNIIPHELMWPKVLYEIAVREIKFEIDKMIIMDLNYPAIPIMPDGFTTATGPLLK